MFSIITRERMKAMKRRPDETAMKTMTSVSVSGKYRMMLWKVKTIIRIVDLILENLAFLLT